MTAISQSDQLVLRRAFPSYLGQAAEKVIAALPPGDYSPSDGFTVILSDEEVVIPYRIYNPKEEHRPTSSPCTSDEIITDCIYTRHHDGFVRQEHLGQLLSTEKEWVVPFVLQLLGEYVIEIIQLLQTNASAFSGSNFKKFSDRNVKFVERTKSRIVSYWDCYYRNKYPEFAEYPGFLVADKLGWWGRHDLPRLRAR